MTAPGVAPSDLALTGGILAGVSVYLFAVQRATAARRLSSLATRKLVHITCGPAFVALWPFYSDAAGARLLAAGVPLLFAGVLLVSGTTRAGRRDSDGEGGEGDDGGGDGGGGDDTVMDDRRGALARALSRGGKAAEALEGPLYYSLTLLALSVTLFQSAAAGIAICQLCVGDGLAEVCGRWLGSGTEWTRVRAAVAGGAGADTQTVHKGKSVAGSMAFVVGATVASLACVGWLQNFGLTSLDPTDPATVARVAGLSAVCAAVELAPREVIGDDNVAIVVASVALSVAMWGGAVL